MTQQIQKTKRHTKQHTKRHTKKYTKKYIYKNSKQRSKQRSKQLDKHTTTTNKHAYTKYYPSILKPNFSYNIAHHDLFKKYKIDINKKKINDLYNAFDTNTNVDNSNKHTKAQHNIYILKPFQKMLRNFMSPYSPYRGLFIYHEMGVGKTCTSITIAETLKQTVKHSDSKIYILRSDEFERQIFNINAVRNNKPLAQCTGNTYLEAYRNNSTRKNMYDKYATYANDMINNCANGNINNSCEQIQNKINKELKTTYEFTGAQIWARKIQKLIDMKTKNITGEELKNKKIQSVIQKKFNNSVIIVDEAHDLRDTNIKDSKIVPPILNLVLKYSRNLRLIFLSATPIYDKPQNIISLINYLLINDKRPPMNVNDVFDSEGNIKADGHSILTRNINGYISYLRGNNPYDFPIRIPAKFNIPDKILNLHKYPQKDIHGVKLQPNDKIQHLELVECKMRGAQLDILNYHIKNDNIPSIDVSKMDELSTIIIKDNEYDNEEEDNEDDNEEDNEKDNDDDNEEDNDDKKNKKDKKDKQNDIHNDKNDNNKNDNNKNDNNKNNKEDNKDITEKTVAYLFDRQISNIVYQTLEECNNNIKSAVGDIGLSNIVTKHAGVMTYKFNHPKYAERFKMPELYNWGAKIAQVVDIVIQSKGPVFIYSFFNSAGILPLAFALEMNGYKRYKQHDRPLLEYQGKSPINRGDYIIYTGNKTLSAYAQEYINKGNTMIHEHSVKVFIGTSKASEGLNLFGYREAHILDPWHNINLTEQSIGRVIRTGSHLHLPPQDRNVTVYQYATTLADRESIDLTIYKMCEQKAIKSGVVEKILKENALDCELYKDINIYSATNYNKLVPLITSQNKHIKISLADIEYSRSCFYMKKCEFSCNTKLPKSSDSSAPAQASAPAPASAPIMAFSYAKEIEEYTNLILQLLTTTFNIKIKNLRHYLHNIINDIDNADNVKPKTANANAIVNINIEDIDDPAFNTAITNIINTDMSIKDKYGRNGKVVLSGEYLRFIPDGNLSPNMSIQKQYAKPEHTTSAIDLKSYITNLTTDTKKLLSNAIHDYDTILTDMINMIDKMLHNMYKKDLQYNSKIKKDEVFDIVFSKMIYTYKLMFLKQILLKLIKQDALTVNELQVYNANVLNKHIIYYDDIFPAGNKQQVRLNTDKTIYGFIIQNESKLELFTINPTTNIFEKNQGNIRKVIEFCKAELNKTPHNKLYGYIRYEKGREQPNFKITDMITKGDKKAVSGIICYTKKSNEIKKIVNKLDDKLFKNKTINHNKHILCNDIELILKRKDNINLDGKKWYYTPEEYYIYFENTI